MYQFEPKPLKTRRSLFNARYTLIGIMLLIVALMLFISLQIGKTMGYAQALPELNALKREEKILDAKLDNMANDRDFLLEKAKCLPTPTPRVKVNNEE